MVDVVVLAIDVTEVVECSWANIRAECVSEIDEIETALELLA